MQSSRLRQWIVELVKLTPSAPEWEEFASFTEIISGIAQRKALELEDLKLISELDTLIETLQLQLPGEIAFFEMYQITRWTGGSCAFESRKSVVEEIANFIHILRGHAQLREKSESTYTKDQERLRRLDQLATAAVGAYRRLCELFSSGVGDSPDPGRGQSVELPVTHSSVVIFGKDTILTSENQIEEPSSSDVIEALSIVKNPSVGTELSEPTDEAPANGLTLANQEISIDPAPEFRQGTSEGLSEAKVPEPLTGDLLPP